MLALTKLLLSCVKSYTFLSTVQVFQYDGSVLCTGLEFGFLFAIGLILVAFFVFPTPVALVYICERRPLVSHSQAHPFPLLGYSFVPFSSIKLVALQKLFTCYHQLSAGYHNICYCCKLLLLCRCFSTMQMFSLKGWKQSIVGGEGGT